MKILFFYGKYSQRCWLVDTPARLDGAKRALFQELDGRGCYQHLLPDFRDLIETARAGDMNHINAILKMRNGVENETWAILPADIAEDKSLRYAPFMGAAILNRTQQSLYGQP